MSDARLLIWGCGELGTRVARRWMRRSGPALGWTRTERRHDELRRAGIEPFVGSPLEHLRADDRLLIATPGSESQAACSLRLDDAEVRPRRAVLIGSTAIHAGLVGRIDEASPAGDSHRARAAQAAEVAFRARMQDRGVVLRLGGLFARDRGPAAAVRRKGSMRPGPPDRTLALIHYDDAAEATYQALVHPHPHGVYVCVADPLPTRREFYEALAEELPPGALRLEFTEPTGRPRAAYDVTRMRRELLPIPHHPDWREAVRG